MAQWIARMAAAETDYRTSSDASLKILAQHQAQSGTQSQRGRNESAASHFGPWVAEAVEVVQLHSADRGARAADAIREQLMERDQYGPAL